MLIFVSFLTISHMTEFYKNFHFCELNLAHLNRYDAVKMTERGGASAFLHQLKHARTNKPCSAEQL